MKKVVFYIFSILFFISCNNAKKEAENDVFTNTGIYSKQSFTDLVLTESDLATFFKTFSEYEKISTEVYQYYSNREYQYAWFNSDGMTLAVSNFQNQLHNYRNDFGDSSIINKQIDPLIVELKNETTNSVLKENQVKKLELLLTSTFFIYSKKVFSGSIENPYNLNWYIPKNKKNYQTLLDSLVKSGNNNKIWEPTNRFYSSLKQKLKDYRKIQKKGGFPTVLISDKEIKVSDKDSSIINVKRYLEIVGDLKNNDKTIAFTDSLSSALMRFQHRMGLKENGQLDQNTVEEINKPIDFRIKQIMINMERLRWFPDEIENNFLIVNIPEFKLHVFENGKKVWDAKVVVGKEANRTSIFKGNISQIILNPYWNVPNSIINKEMLPILKRNRSYLSKNNFEVLSGNKIVNSYSINWRKYTKNIPFTIRQKPGPTNSLGKIKFLFPNDYSIYLHDTPSKNLFNETNRAFSHGCIRVENPKKLAVYLLRNDSRWNEERIDTILNNKKTFDINLKSKIEVYIVYFTAWVDGSGQINFRNDLYNLDNQLESEIFSTN